MSKKNDISIPSADELYKKAKKLQPALLKRADQTAELRRLPDETIQDFKDLGFFKILQPIRWGGYEMDPVFLQKEMICWSNN